MDITPLISAHSQVIQSYGGSRFKVSGQTYEGAVLVAPDKTLSWPVENPDIDGLENHHFDFIKKNFPQCEVLLLGTGKIMHFVKPHLRNYIQTLSMGVEPMDTGAACRTYNVLLAEGRQVVAALLPV